MDNKQVHPFIHPLTLLSLLHKAKANGSQTPFPRHKTTITDHPHSPIFSPSRHRPLKFSPISSSSNAGESSAPESERLPWPQITPPRETVEVRFRRRSRRQSRQQRDINGNGSRRFAKAEQTLVQKKKWEDMNVAEKAMELYMGERGLLLWLNKFA